MLHSSGYINIHDFAYSVVPELQITSGECMQLGQVCKRDLASHDKQFSMKEWQHKESRGIRRLCEYCLGLC